MQNAKIYLHQTLGDEAIVIFYDGPPFKYKKTNKVNNAIILQI